jgi:hypothetical protein
MNEQAMDFTGFPELPSYEAEWAAVYMEPIVQSGERLTIGVVAFDGAISAGRLAISEKALNCLYGDSADGMQHMMEMALQRAQAHAATGFSGNFTAGMHGVSIGPKRSGIGNDLEDILQQATSLTSSLCSLHQDDEATDTHDRSTYWRRLQVEMKRINPGLTSYFGKPVPVTIRGSEISLACDYYSSRLAVNIAALQPGNRLGHLFDSASSRIFRLEQLKQHDSLIGNDQRGSLMLVTPTDDLLSRFSQQVQRTFKERVLLLQDMADTKNFGIIEVTDASSGASWLDQMERIRA